MQETAFSHSKYNISWISIMVIFLGTIIYPIFFQRVKEPDAVSKVQTVSNIEQTKDTYTVLPKVAESPKPVHSSGYVFTRNLTMGDTGPDVKKLQEYLNQRGFIVATYGNGSPGHESELFGPGTRDALKKFQETYAEILLAPYGLKQGTGFLGNATRNFINS